MACPKCGCKCTYQYDDGDECHVSDESLERCAACGHVFDIEDHADEPDDQGPDMASRRSRERENASLPADVARCAGVGSDTEGWRDGCEDCLRRTCAPTDHPWVAHMDPPKVIVFFCPYHMQPERCPNTGDLFEGDDDGSSD